MLPIVWLAAVLMLIGAVMLVTGVGAAGLWIAVITIGIGLLVADRTRTGRSQRPDRS
jgi:hypothetical protein